MSHHLELYRNELLKIINQHGFEFLFYPEPNYPRKYRWLKYVPYYRKINELERLDRGTLNYCFMLLDKMAKEENLKEFSPNDLVELWKDTKRTNLSGLLTDWLDYSHVESALTFYKKGINFSTSPMPPSSYEFVFMEHAIDELKDFCIFSKYSMEVYERASSENLTSKQLKVIETMLKIIDIKWLIQLDN